VHRQGGRASRDSVDEAAVMAAVQRAHVLGRWRSWRRTDLGASNVSWFVETDAGSVVLRRSHPLKTGAGARFECALIDVLRAHGYPAPAVQRTRDGGVLVEVDGVVHMVMHRLPGAGYDAGSPGHLAAAARGLARYHTIVSEFAVPTARNRSFALGRLGPGGRKVLSAAVEVVGPLLAADARAAVRDSARHLADQMERLADELDDRQDGLTTLVVHGSYGPTALLLTDDRLTGVLDFDRAETDLLGLDLAYALDAFCRPGPVRRTGTGLDPYLTREFLAHYRSQASVADADLRAVPALLRAQRLGKVLKKCDNVLTRQATAPQQQKDVTRFPRVLERECARVRWLTDNLPTLMENR
jgi:Ser/Thr protein kinase RdoA (MazF antagonist)